MWCLCAMGDYLFSGSSDKTIKVSRPAVTTIFFFLLATVKKYNISTNFIQVIKNLCDKATSAVLFNNSVGDWFQTAVGVRQRCLLLPNLFSIFLEKIMTDALEDHEGSVSIGGRTITNLRFADDIDGLEGEAELAKIDCLGKASTAYGIEISAGKTILMTNNTSGINTEIKVNGQKLETFTRFKYLGSVITDEGSKPEIALQDSTDNGSIDKVKPVWNDRCISLSFKIRQMCSFVTSSFLYVCESWTLTAEL